MLADKCKFRNDVLRQLNKSLLMGVGAKVFSHRPLFILLFWAPKLVILCLNFAPLLPTATL